MVRAVTLIRTQFGKLLSLFNSFICRSAETIFLFSKSKSSELRLIEKIKIVISHLKGLLIRYLAISYLTTNAYTGKIKTNLFNLIKIRS